MTSLPVPDSPWISTVASVGATRSTRSRTLRMAGELRDQAGQAVALAELGAQVLVLAAQRRPASALSMR